MTSFSATLPKAGWRRRARPLLGTLVELGVPADAVPDAEDEAFAAVAAVQATLSRFEPDSDLARLQALPAGVELPLRPAARRVFRAAQALRDASGGAFDVTLGSGCFDWRCRQGRLQRDHDAVHFDLGGLAKGHALDAAVAALRRRGCVAGWANAGGDLRVFGDLALPLWLRDEDRGGVQPFATLGDGALATSRFGPGSRDRLWRAGTAARPTPDGGEPVLHVTVAAPHGLWADALTKLVALAGDARHGQVAPLLSRLRAQAWVHHGAAHHA